VPSPHHPEDPRVRLLRNARREALIVLAVWAACLLWVVGFSYLRGYQHPPEHPLVEAGIARARDAADFSSVAGIPDWLFAGVALPWLIATLFTIVFGMRILRDDDLGEEREEGTGDGGGTAGGR
jgi:hypothetical protein